MEWFRPLWEWDLLLRALLQLLKEELTLPQAKSFPPLQNTPKLSE